MMDGAKMPGGMPEAGVPPAPRVRLRRLALQKGDILMEITVNGENLDFTGRPILSELLRHLGIDPKKVAVERNLAIIPRSRIESEPVRPGDAFEIIRLIGGG